MRQPNTPSEIRAYQARRDRVCADLDQARHAYNLALFDLREAQLALQETSRRTGAHDVCARAHQAFLKAGQKVGQLEDRLAGMPADPLWVDELHSDWIR